MRLLNVITIGAMSSLILAGCETSPSDPVTVIPPAGNHHHKLADTQWSWDAGLERNPILEFRANGHLGGFSGCNQIGGVFEESEDIKDGRHLFRISEVISTEMACAKGMSEEAQFIKALANANSFTRSSSDLLVLYDTDGDEILRLKKIN